MPTVMNDAIELYYETFGIQDDPVVVCLPGMGNQLLIYPEAFCMALVDRGFFVIRMDNRDAGLSSITADGDEYTLSDMADDVVAGLDDVGVVHGRILQWALRWGRLGRLFDPGLDSRWAARTGFALRTCPLAGFGHERGIASALLLPVHVARQL